MSVHKNHGLSRTLKDVLSTSVVQGCALAYDATLGLFVDTVRSFDIGAVAAEYLSLVTTTAATAVVTEQGSPGLRFGGRGWLSAADTAIDYMVRVGANVAGGIGELQLWARLGAAAYAKMHSFSSQGAAYHAGALTLGSALTSGATSANGVVITNATNAMISAPDPVVATDNQDRTITANVDTELSALDLAITLPRAMTVEIKLALCVLKATAAGQMYVDIYDGATKIWRGMLNDGGSTNMINVSIRKELATGAHTLHFHLYKGIGDMTVYGATVWPSQSSVGCV